MGGKVSLGVSICIDKVLIASLNLDGYWSDVRLELFQQFKSSYVQGLEGVVF
jgi:hypothetical protein